MPIAPRQPPIRVVIDTDPGIDDVVTLALAARSPELHIAAVTTTYGNATLDVLTIGELLAPGLLTFAEVRLAADLDDGEHRGHTRERADAAPTKVALRVDTTRMRELLKIVFSEPSETL